MINDINPNELKAQINNDDVVLIDVRESFEHQSEAIDGAHHIALNEISSESIQPLADKKIIVHCTSGKRGQSACQKIHELLPNAEIYNLSGGINAWKKAGYTIKEGKIKRLPVDQQVQLTIGTLLIISSLLIYFAHPFFVIIPLFLGCGLCFAGLSGTCGMAILISKMPWNKAR